MELRIEHLTATVTRATPCGRWDIAGAAVIDLKLSALAGSGRALILDLAEVSYLSSMGIRSILISAKAAKLRGGAFVLAAPLENVAEVLIAAGIDSIIPMYANLENARQALP